MLMTDRGFVSPDLSFKVITYFLLGKLPSCLVAFFLLLRLTFIHRFQAVGDNSLGEQMFHPFKHVLASIWVGVLGWELSMVGAVFGVMMALLLIDPAEVHAIWAYLSVEYDTLIAVRGLLRTAVHAAALSTLLYFESIVMEYWQSDKETRMTQFIFLGLIAVISIEVLDTVMFLNRN